MECVLNQKDFRCKETIATEMEKLLENFTMLDLGFQEDITTYYYLTFSFHYTG